jgi:hypothetical protein
MTSEQALAKQPWWKTVLTYMGFRRQSEVVVADAAALADFLNTRAAHVAQTTLYGYLRARAGVRFPELFSNDEFVVSINQAKWNIWVACVSDLTVFAGLLIVRQSGDANCRPALIAAVDSILDRQGVPDEAGPAFGGLVDRLRQRIRLCDWNAYADDEGPFVESPEALVRWAPIVDELKQLDEEIVRNSMRFRWNETRKELLRTLDVPAFLASSRAA